MKAKWKIAIAVYWLACAAVSVTCFSIAAKAESKNITVAQALSMAQALRSLDGRQVVTKINGVEQAVTTPWDFGNGTLRLRIAKNISALTAIESMVETSRLNIVGELLAKMPVDKNGNRPTTIPQDSPEWSAFQKQIGEMLNQPAQVTLTRIRASELKLDKNEIPVTTLSALDPILDE